MAFLFCFRRRSNVLPCSCSFYRCELLACELLACISGFGLQIFLAVYIQQLGCKLQVLYACDHACTAFRGGPDGW